MKVGVILLYQILFLPHVHPFPFPPAHPHHHTHMIFCLLSSLPAPTVSFHLLPMLLDTLIDSLTVRGCKGPCRSAGLAPLGFHPFFSPAFLILPVQYPIRSSLVPPNIFFPFLFSFSSLSQHRLGSVDARTRKSISSNHAISHIFIRSTSPHAVSRLPPLPFLPSSYSFSFFCFKPFLSSLLPPADRRSHCRCRDCRKAAAPPFPSPIQYTPSLAQTKR